MSIARRLLRDRMFRAGLALFAVGVGPLLAVILAAQLGLTSDPNPNPVGFGILAFFTFWPSIVLMVVGALRRRRGNASACIAPPPGERVGTTEER